MRWRRVLLFFCAIVFVAASAQAQPPPAPAGLPPNVEKLGPDLFRIGAIRVNTTTREVSVPGTVNEVSVLEFIANTKGGMKAYESALTLDTDAITYNVALVLVGLDRAHAVAPRQHFDPAPVSGDPVEVWVEWGSDGRKQRVPAGRLLFDKVAGREVPEGRWVYTGSQMLDGGRYLAELDGVLIGFVHSPAPVIEHVGGAGIGQYGSIVLNPKVGLTPGTAVTVTVKAIGGSPAGK